MDRMSDVYRPSISAGYRRGQLRLVESLGGHFRWHVGKPRWLAVRNVRSRKADDLARPLPKRLVEAARKARSENRKAANRLYRIEQLSHVLVSLPVATVLNVGAPAEQCIGLVEKQYRAKDSQTRLHISGIDRERTFDRVWTHLVS